MADNIDINVNVNTSNAQTNIANLNKQLANTQKNLAKTQKSLTASTQAFGALRSSLAGIAIGAFAVNMLRTADAIDDLSKATGLSIATINGFGAALARSGGEANDAGTLLGKLSQAIEEGREGTLKAEYQFGKLGISIQELRTLSDEDILRKTIEGLAKMPAGAERTALAMQLLGKNARMIDWNNLNGSIDKFIASSKKAEPGTKALAQLFDNLQGIGKSFTNQLTIGGTNFAETLAKLTTNTDAIAKSLANLVKIIGAFGIALGLLSLPKRISEFGDFLQTLKKGEGLAGTFTRGLNNLKTALQQIVAVFTLGAVSAKNWTGGVLILGDAFSNLVRFIGRVGGVIGVLFTLGEVIKPITGNVNLLVSAFKILRDIAVVSIAGYVEAFKLLLNVIKPVTDLLKVGFTAAAQVLKNTFGPAIDFISSKLSQFANFWKSTVKDAERALGMNKFDARNLGAREATPEESGVRFPGGAEAAMALEDERTELQKLRDAIIASTQAYTDQRKAALAALQAQASYVNMSEEARDILNAQTDIYNDFNQKIDEYKQKIIELSPEQEKLRQTYLDQILVLEQLRDEQMQQAAEAVQATRQQIEAQLDLQQELQNTASELQRMNALEDLRSELELMGLYGEELEKQTRILDVQRQMRDEVQQAILDTISLENRRSQLSDQQYNREKTNIENSLRMATETAKERLKIDEEYFKRKEELENSYIAGVALALQDIERSLKPINVAQDAVTAAFKAMEDSIDNFVETGKFKFKDFAASVIADLTKIIAKALVLSAIKSVFSAIGFSIPGLAEGGPAKAGKPYLVGEKGPELFVPQTSGTVVPNNKMNSNNVGEVSAPITNNYITNNINAIDAKSVAQLFVENRKTLLGTVKMAERELPYLTQEPN